MIVGRPATNADMDTGTGIGIGIGIGIGAPLTTLLMLLFALGTKKKKSHTRLSSSTSDFFFTREYAFINVTHTVDNKNTVPKVKSNCAAKETTYFFAFLVFFFAFFLSVRKVVQRIKGPKLGKSHSWTYVAVRARKKAIALPTSFFT